MKELNVEVIIDGKRYEPIENKPECPFERGQWIIWREEKREKGIKYAPCVVLDTNRGEWLRVGWFKPSSGIWTIGVIFRDNLVNFMPIQAPTWPKSESLPEDIKRRVQELHDVVDSL